PLNVTVFSTTGSRSRWPVLAQVISRDMPGAGGVVSTTLTRFGASLIGRWWTSSWVQLSRVQVHCPALSTFPPSRRNSTWQALAGAVGNEARPARTSLFKVSPPQWRITWVTLGSGTLISSGAVAQAAAAN